MSAQHLTPPHSAEKIEASHHVESSEGHQVPGPPHAHGHDGHDPHHAHDAGSGKVVALIALVVLIGGAAAIGVRAPDAWQPVHGAGASFSEEGGVPGVVVLDDGTTVTGTLSERERSFVVRTGEGEVVLPKGRVRYAHRGGTTLPDEYWRQHGHLPVDAQVKGGGGGIVVTKTGEVFVGRVTVDGRGVTVSWPHGAQTFTGEVTIPHDRVRYFDAKRETLGEDYWRQFPDERLEPRWQRREEPRRAGGEGAALPDADRERRSAATLAQTQGRWEEAAEAWARVYARSQMPGDLKNLLTCTGRMLDHGFESDRPKVQRAQELLSPFGGLPAVRDVLAETYLKAVSYHLPRKQVQPARRWAQLLESFGGQHAQDARDCLRAIARVEHDLEEEAAEEHEEHEGR